MEQHELLKFKKTLEKLKKELSFDIEAQESDYLPNDVLDEMDQASEEINQRIGSFTANNLRMSLGIVAKMLKNIENGSYGRCVECGTKIPLRRLRAMPLTEYCIKCQIEMENDF